MLVFVFSEIGYESRVHFLRVDLEVAYSIIISQPCQINLRRSEATADEICGEGGEKNLNSAVYSLCRVPQKEARNSERKTECRMPGSQMSFLPTSCV